MIEVSPELSIISKVTAFLSLFLWILTWLPKPLVLTSPKGSLFDVLFSAPYLHSKFIIFVAWISLVAHVLCVCLQTGFLLNGIESPAIYEIWMVPDGDFRTYSIVVGIPCAAFIAFTVATFVRIVTPDVDTLTGVKKWIVWGLCSPSGLLVTIVFLINYVEQLVYRASICEGYANELAALAYYGVVIFIVVEAYWLYYSTSKKLKKMLKSGKIENNEEKSQEPQQKQQQKQQQQVQQLQQSQQVQKRKNAKKTKKN